MAPGVAIRAGARAVAVVAAIALGLAASTLADGPPSLSFNPFDDAAEGEEAAYRFRLSGAGAVAGAGDEWVLALRIGRVGERSVVVRHAGDGDPIEVEAARGPDGRDAVSLLRVVVPDLAAGGTTEVAPETVEVGGVRYEAERVAHVVTTEVEGIETTERLTAWFAPEAPVAGLVKLVATVAVSAPGEPATETRIEAELVPPRK